MKIVQNIRKATWQSKLLEDNSTDSDSVFFGNVFPPARPKGPLRKDKRGLADVACNSWWHMKCTQHAALNPKFEEIIHTSLVVALEKIKHPSISLMLASTKEIVPPPPTTIYWGKSCWIYFSVKTNDVPSKMHEYRHHTCHQMTDRCPMSVEEWQNYSIIMAVYIL